MKSSIEVLLAFAVEQNLNYCPVLDVVTAFEKAVKEAILSFHKVDALHVEVENSDFLHITEGELLYVDTTEDGLEPYYTETNDYYINWHHAYRILHM